MRCLWFFVVMLLAAGCPAGTPPTRRSPPRAPSLDASDWRERVRAVRRLASQREAKATLGLLRALRDSRAEVRMAALGGLAGGGSLAARQAVLDALRDPALPVRVAAVYALARWRDVAVDARLRKVLVRQADALAAEAAGVLVARLEPGPAADRRRRLVALLSQVDLLPRHRRKSMLKRLRARRQGLLALLVDLGSDPALPLTVQTTAMTLFGAPDAAGFRLVLARFESATPARGASPKRFVALADWVRLGAKALGAKAVPLLLRAWKRSPAPHRAVLDRALCERGPATPASVFVRGLQSPVDTTRAACLGALGEHAVPGTIPALFAALAQEKVTVIPVLRTHWMEYFFALRRGKPGLAMLRRALGHPHVLVRVVALRLAGHLGSALAREVWLAARDPERDVRLAAAVALGATGGGADRLRAWIRGRDPVLRVAALFTAARQGRGGVAAAGLTRGRPAERVAAYLALAAAGDRAGVARARREAARGPATLQPWARRYLDVLAGRSRLPRDLRHWLAKELTRRALACVPRPMRERLREAARREIRELELVSAHSGVRCLLKAGCGPFLACMGRNQRSDGRFVEYFDHTRRRKRREGSYLDGRKVGRWVTRDERGRVIRVCTHGATGKARCTPKGPKRLAP